MSSKTIGQLHKELKEIIEWFEGSSETDVDKAIKKYEKAQIIAKELKTKLDGLDNKIKTIEV